jgi:outer membrane immunogenic protein
LGGIKENDALAIGTAATAASFNHTQGGWALGAGVEKIIAGNWTAKLEYLYVDLGTITDSFVLAPGATETIHQNVTDHIVRLGLNYRY